MSITRRGIPPKDFYCERNPLQDEIEAIIQKQRSCGNPQEPKFMHRLLGPSQTWEVFKKQQDAIDCCLYRRNGLMPFAYEDVNGRRMFLAAHPKVFWALNGQRFFKNCYSYEIIRENSVCKLYLDIEYEYAYNCNREGIRMLNNLLNIININIRNTFNIICTENDILDLDSSSNSKFSHHIIYEIQNVAFKDNYAVGSFIKKVCAEVKEAFESSKLGDNSKLQLLSDKYGLPKNDILELVVQDRKGQMKLFIDENVYTKNRHFRLLGSSKLSKQVPLTICKTNKYKLNGESEGLEYFLDSLVTYFSWKILRVLEFEELRKLKPQRTMKVLKLNSEGAESFIHSKIDSFINKLVSPKGWIRKKFCFSNSSTIVYDIQGYRYCHNIQQEHKSNNIKYVVDLKNLNFYQKCHDPDCADFRSDATPLPEGICFLFEDDSLFLSEPAPDCEELSEEDLIKAVEIGEHESKFEQNIPDEVLDFIVDCTEATIDTYW